MKKKNFWNNFKKPFFVLAPMADVTDVAFRQIIAKYGKPDVFFTEFVSCDGLLSDGKEHLLRDLKYGEGERPIVAQIFSGKPEHFYECTKMMVELGFDGVDVNMGCPDRSVEKQGAGAALMKDPKRAREIIREMKRGAGDIPVSVKTRIGYNKNELDSWLPEILAEEPAVVTIHARTRKEMSKVSAHWEEIAHAVKIRDSMGSKTLIVGNGDVKDLNDARKKAKETGADGVMIGRGIFGNPWLFANLTRLRKRSVLEEAPCLSKSEAIGNKQQCREAEMSRERSDGKRSDLGEQAQYQPTIEERLNVMVEHTKLFEKICDHKNFAVMKKHYKAYVTGFDGAKELRIKLMEAKDASEVEGIISHFLKH